MSILEVSQLFILIVVTIPLFLVIRGWLRMDIAALLIAVGLGLDSLGGCKSWRLRDSQKKL